MITLSSNNKVLLDSGRINIPFNRILAALAFYLVLVSAVEVRYVGVDAPIGDLATLYNITSSLSCAQACDDTANCKAWVWSYPGHGCPRNANTCWLKRSFKIFETIDNNNCREMGYATGQAGVDRSGVDLPGMPIASNTSSSCAAVCKSTAGCVAWSFDSCGKQNCWLKKSVTGTSSDRCRISGVQEIPSGPQCKAGNICHYNNCPYSVNLFQVTNNGPSTQVCTLAKGQSCNTNVAKGWAGNYKHNSNGLSLAEFKVVGFNNLDYYDISYIVGFDAGIKIETTKGRTLNCPSFQCADAYHKPNDIQTHSVPTDGLFTVTWCPP